MCQKSIGIDDFALGTQLRAFRIASGLTLRDLSQHIPVSPQALSQYENGHIRPRMEVLYSLASALEISVEQLLAIPSDREQLSITIHHLDTSNRWIRNDAKSSMAAMIERSLAIERRLGNSFPSPSLPLKYSIAPINDSEEAEILAREVRQRWTLGTGPLPNLVSLLETRGIRVFEIERKSDQSRFRSCSAFVSLVSKSAPKLPVLLVNSTLPNELKRFQLCHELAHMILPPAVYSVVRELDRTRFANWFSGSLLLPTAALHEQLGRRRTKLSWYELVEVKRQFGVSLKVIVQRCRQVGIIGRATYRTLRESCSLMDSRSVNFQEEIFQIEGTESSTRLRRLTLRALTEGIVTFDEAVRLLDVQPDLVRRWIESSSGNCGNDKDESDD